MSHHCHATGCKVAVPPERFVCLRHWRMLPKAMQKAIWDNYRVGQCDDMQPSKSYCEAAKAAVIYLANKDGVKPDTKLYDFLGELKDDDIIAQAEKS